VNATFAVVKQREQDKDVYKTAYRTLKPLLQICNSLFPYLMKNSCFYSLRYFLSSHESQQRKPVKLLPRFSIFFGGPMLPGFAATVFFADGFSSCDQEQENKLKNPFLLQSVSSRRDILTHVRAVFVLFWRF